MLTNEVAAADGVLLKTPPAFLVQEHGLGGTPIQKDISPSQL